MAESGIYKIVSTCGKVYVGSAIDLHKRKINHFGTLSRNVHSNSKLQNYVNKYGIDSIVFEVIENCDKGLLIDREQYYIDTLNPFFNICRVAGNTLGQSGGMKGKKTSEHPKNTVSKIHTGKILSEETKRKISDSAKGRTGFWSGKKLSEETKKKISESRKLLGIKLSDEHMQKLTFKGKSHTDEHKKMMSDKMKGVPKSEEHKHNLRKPKNIAA